MKHYFMNRPESLKADARNRCMRCGKGKSHSSHLKPSIPMLLNWLFDEKFEFFNYQRQRKGGIIL